MSFLELVDVTKSFGDHGVLRRASLSVEEGEIVALLGPSGSGKTTLLRIVAGFETGDEGRILVGGDDVTGVAPARRGFGMVFQHYALFPHLTVGENVAFGLESRGRSRPEIAGRVEEVLSLVDLAGFEKRPVTALSGGQQQRVAVARAVAPEPRLLLLDEPLSNLDPALRERTRRGLAELVRRVGTTTLIVTHEQQEAFELGERVAVLSAGRLQQVGTPDDLYERPETPFVAGFVGRANVVSGVARREDGGWAVEAGDGSRWPGEPAEPLEDGARVELYLRPEAAAIVEPDEPGSVAAEILARRYGGSRSLFVARLDGGRELEIEAPSRSAAVGDRVGLAPAPAGPRGRIWGVKDDE